MLYRDAHIPAVPHEIIEEVAFETTANHSVEKEKRYTLP